MSKPGNAWRKIRGRITHTPYNFSWVIEGKLAGSGAPTTRQEFDWIRAQDVDSIVTMTLEALPEDWVADIGGYLHAPTEDLAAPLMGDIERAVAFAHKKISSGRRVMVHCAAGKGRAGTILACYLIRHGGLGAEEAIERIRELRPGSVQSEPQVNVIRMYERRVRAGD